MTAETTEFITEISVPDAAHFLNELEAGLPDGNSKSLDPMDESPEPNEVFEAMGDVLTNLETIPKEIKDIVDE